VGGVGVFIARKIRQRKLRFCYGFWALKGEGGVDEKREILRRRAANVSSAGENDQKLI